MATHRYWRVFVYKTYGAITNATVGVTCAELEMHSTMGGFNICTGGTPFASSDVYFAVTHAPSLAFDGNTTTFWGTTVSCPGYIGYDFGFGNAVNVVEIKWTSATSAGGGATYAPYSFMLQFSDDNVNWLCYQQGSTIFTWSGNSQVEVFDFTAYSWPTGPYTGNGTSSDFDPTKVPASPDTPSFPAFFTMEGPGTGPTGSYSYAKSLVGYNIGAGKFYMEFYFPAADTFYVVNQQLPALGLSDSYNSPGTTPSDAILSSSGGSIVTINTSGGDAYGVTAFCNGCHVGMAVDFINQTIWVRVDGNYWNESSTANPTTNTGGADLSGSGPLGPGPDLYPLYYFAFVAGNSTNEVIVNTGASNFDMPPPSGFAAGWGPASSSTRQPQPVIMS